MMSMVSQDVEILHSSNIYQSEWDMLFCPKFYQEHLQSLAIKGHLKTSHFRSICWKVFLKCLPENKSLWIDSVKSQRQKYEEILDKFDTNPRASVSLDISVNNPLSQSLENPWVQYFDDSELKITIEQDVVRTFPEIDFFHKKNVQAMMTSILFSYAREVPDVSYKQGMHELLAPILFVLNYDVEGFLEYSKKNKIDFDLHVMLNPNYIEHDAYFIFCKLMAAVEPWYTANDYSYKKFTKLNPEPFAQKVSTFPANCLGQHLRKIYEQLLKHHDNELFRRLEELEITPQIFGIRWLRLLFGREFSMPDLLIVWDALFAYSNALDLVDFIFVAMLISIKDLLLPCDYASCLTHLMRFPNVADVRYIIDLALYLKDPDSCNQPTGKVVNPLQLKASREYKRPANIHLKKKSNDKRQNSLTSYLLTNVRISSLDVGKAQSPDLANNPNKEVSSEFNEFEDDSLYFIARDPCYDSLPRTTISKVMESTSCVDQVSKIINEDYIKKFTETSKFSSREMVPLYKPNDFMTQINLSEEPRNFYKEDISSVKFMQKEISQKKLIIDCCAEQITLHLDKLQKTMISQPLQHEDEIYLAIAGLKRVQDILTGKICVTKEIKDDLDHYYSISGSNNLLVDESSKDNSEKFNKLSDGHSTSAIKVDKSISFAIDLHTSEPNDTHSRLIDISDNDSSCNNCLIVTKI